MSVAGQPDPGYWSARMVTAGSSDIDTAIALTDTGLTHLLSDFRDHPDQTSVVITWHDHDYDPNGKPCSCHRRKGNRA